MENLLSCIKEFCLCSAKLSSISGSHEVWFDGERNDTMLSHSHPLLLLPKFKSLRFENTMPRASPASQKPWKSHITLTASTWDTMPPGLSPSPPPRCSSMGASVVPLVPLEHCYNGCLQNSLWCSMQRTRCLCLLDRTLNTLTFMLPLVAGLTCSTIQSPPIADCSIP